MRRALVPAFLLLLGSVVLAATVLREPLAKAATPIASVFVTNDSSHPLPVREQNLDANGNIKVHEQGTTNVNVTNDSAVPVKTQQQLTEYAAEKELQEGGSPLDASVAQYREIRVVSTLASPFICSPGDQLIVDASEGGTLFFDLGTISFCQGADSFSRTFEVPGTAVAIRCSCDAATQVIVAIYGRAN